MATINLALNVQVVGGPQALISQPLSVEAYDKIEVTVKPGDTLDVAVQPGGAGQVNFLLIKSSLVDEKLTYVVNDGGANNFPTSERIKLAQAFHLYLGKGGVSVFGIAPKVIEFKNDYAAGTTNKDAAIEILVGRDATP
ncbi:MAG TPA: hypothetical protein DCL61_09725 [Cyanobacteria bacterium UBA12227]|nr:hypothetical protein [Cyanobacteria bacterium UBA12227]HAX86488.1 hypothetical protein [Cyanobacteria bacterium UBA11370]HBY76235.1 hypothetical protein [Cyanobacteria bacterium UBA11148]